MTLFESLPKDEDGNIQVPVVFVTTEGEQIAGTVSSNWFQNVFADFINLVVPLTEEKYSELLTIVPGNWELNWAYFRQQGVI